MRGTVLKDVMIDVETLGLTPDSVILSIAAVEFDRDTGDTGRWFYERVDHLQAGRTTCEETYAWWLKQPDEVFHEATSGTTPLRMALINLYAWFTEGQIAWSQGTDFDFPILLDAFKKNHIDIPWEYNAKRDTRTVYDICGFDPKSIEREGNHHNALDDCLHQIRCVHAALRQRATA